jgi:hypothetical protein
MTEEKVSKPVKEHISTILPFQVIEKVLDNPLKIRGIAMTAGMSRNFNIYTPEELLTFSSKLEGAPVYIEHVSVENAIGKVTKTEWDGQNLWYEAEIYEQDLAEKIRKGLVQHVSVGADYEKIDVVDGKIPHGLYNAELSLVAVPGIPQTNITILESLSHFDERKVVKVGSCVFCNNQAHYLISSCKPCFEKISSLGINAFKNYANEALILKEDTLRQVVSETIQNNNADLKSANEKLTAIKTRLEDNEKSLSKTSEDLSECQKKLGEANKTIGQLKTYTTIEGVLKTPSASLPVAEAIQVLESLLPSQTVERSTLGMQRECQTIRQAIYKLKSRLP